MANFFINIFNHLAGQIWKCQDMAEKAEKALKPVKDNRDVAEIWQTKADMSRI